MAITVFIADDHKMMLEGLAQIMKRFGIEVIGKAYELDGLGHKFLESRADVLVIDVRFEGFEAQNGLDVCEEILKADKTKNIVVFSQFDDEWIVEKAYKTGVRAFVRKDEDANVLSDAVKAASAGRDFFSPVAAQLLAVTAVKGMNPSRLLGEKDLKLFVLIADGLSVTDAAEQMGLSYKTVATMLKDVKERLGIDSVADFTKLAIKYGLTSLEVKRKN